MFGKYYICFRWWVYGVNPYKYKLSYFDDIQDILDIFSLPDLEEVYIRLGLKGKDGQNTFHLRDHS